MPSGTSVGTSDPVMGLESEGQDNPAQGQGEQSGSGQEAVSPEDISPRDLYQFDIPSREPFTGTIP